jgi:hypothetical protein
MQTNCAEPLAAMIGRIGRPRRVGRLASHHDQSDRASGSASYGKYDGTGGVSFYGAPDGGGGSGPDA